MDEQSAAWLQGAGDDYYERNFADFGANPAPDLVKAILLHYHAKPKRVLEVGCANGWRLKGLRELWGCEIAGIDPSAKAVADGNRDLANGHDVLVQGTAADLPWDASSFDLVIYGFCLWFCEPSTWFKVVAEGDRVLADGGWMVIHDYVATRCLEWDTWARDRGSERERKTKSWVYDYRKLWLAHPCYRLMGEATNTKFVGFSLETVSLLWKSRANGIAPINEDAVFLSTA